jgi:hypothetical protein
MRTRLLPFALLLPVAAAAAGTARADGLPVEGVDLSRAGVAASDPMAARYVSLPAGRDTLVAAVSQDGGQVRRSRLLDGRFTVPAVAYDGSPGGLSADGRTLALINPRKGFPRRYTTLAVLDTRRLGARDVITLKGDFSFDAISPNGRLLYLVQYLSKRDPTRYLVRLYDLRAGRLLREPIIDPREVGDVMRGMPITRGEPGRSLGLHALRRSREAPLHPRARHDGANGPLHRPARADGPRPARRDAARAVA